MESMGERLRRARLSRGLSLNDVATAVQVHYSTISAYERGTRHPSYSVLSRLAQLYQIPVPFLVCRREDLAGVLPAEMRQFFEIAHERRDVAQMALRAAQFDHEVIYHLDGLLSLLESTHGGAFNSERSGTFVGNGGGAFGSDHSGTLGNSGTIGNSGTLGNALGGALADGLGGRCREAGEQRKDEG